MLENTPVAPPVNSVADLEAFRRKKIRARLTHALSLVNDFQSSSSDRKPELRSFLAGMIVDFCRSRNIIKSALGISDSQLEAISNNAEIPEAVVTTLAKHLEAAIEDFSPSSD